MAGIEKPYTYLHEFHGDKLEALLFEALDNVSDEAAVHAVGLDHDEGSFVVRHVG